MACAEGITNKAVAEQLGITNSTVGKWRQRFVTRRTEGLLDEPRPGAPHKVSDEDVERVIILTLESTPKEATHWSTRSIGQGHRYEPDCNKSDMACVRLTTTSQ